MAVLNVHADPSHRRRLTAVLEEAGFEVAEACDGREALARVARNPPELVVLAADLPDINGLGICRAVRADPALRRVPVLLVSERFASSQERGRGLDEGADACLPWPFEPSELVAAARALLRTRRAEEASGLGVGPLLSILERSAAGVWEWDIRAGVLSATAPNHALFGLDPDGPTPGPEDFQRLIHPDDLPAMRDAFRDALQGRTDSYEAEYRIRRADDGAERWLCSCGRVIRGADGRPERLVGISKDVTDRRAEGERLRRSEQFLRTLIAALPDAAVFLVDRDLRYLFADGQALHAAGLRSDDFAGRTPAEAEGPESAVSFEPHIRAALAGTPFRCEREAGGRTYLLHGTPLRDADGTVYAALAVSLDITDRKAAERELAGVRDRLEMAMSAGSVATWIWDIAADRVVADSNLTRFFGITPEEAAGGEVASYVRAIHPEDRPRVEAAIARAVESGTDYQAEYRVTGTDGVERWVLARGRVERDAEGRAVRMPGAVLDITDRCRAEQALAEREEHFRLLAEVNPVGIIRGTAGGGVRYANPAYCRITGRAAEDFASGRVGWADITPPEWLPVDAERIAEARERGVCTPYEKEYLRPDGTRVPVLVGYTLFGEGRAESAAFIMDLAEIRQAREALAESEFRLRLALEASATGIWDWDVGTDAVTWSPQCHAIHGLAPAEFDGTAPGFDRLLHPEDRGRVWSAVRAAIRDRTLYEAEFRIVRPDGRVRWVANRGRASYDAEGRPLRAT